MGKHAQTRKPSRARRAAVVSSGTLLLCLCGAGPALADIGPIPVPQPVDDAVTQVTDTAGVPNPLDVAKSPTDATKPDTRAKHHKHHNQTRLSTSTLSTPKSTTTHVARTPKRQPTHQVTATTLPSYTYGGLRAAAMTTSPLIDAGRAPVTAGVAPAGDTAVLAASSAPSLVTPSPDVLDGTGGESGPRVLIIGLAAMVLGGLSAGHIKVAQDRLAQLIG